MSDATLFDQACEALERFTDLDKLESRGTIRLALKSAGLDARRLETGQLRVVLDKVLPGELTARGVADGAAACARISAALGGLQGAAPAASSPEAIFRRLGG